MRIDCAALARRLIVRYAPDVGRGIGPVADEARDIILLMDSRGQLRDANRAAVGAYGYDYDGLTALNIRDLRAQSTVSDVEGQMAQANAGGVQFETRHRRRDGSEFVCEVSSRRLELDGELFLVSIVRDVTERQRAETLIREKETLLAKVFHSSPVVVSIVDLETTAMSTSTTATCGRSS